MQSKINRAEDQSAYSRLQKLFDKPDPIAAAAPRFGLIVPPSPFVVPTGWEFVHTAPFEGPSIVAALVKSLGLPFRLLDQRQDPDPESLSGGPPQELDIVGLSTYSDSFPYQRRVIEIAKSESPERPVVLGGPLVTSTPLVVMNATGADYAVLGEGELTIIELLDHLMGRPGATPLAAIRGLAWKDAEGKVTINAPRMRGAGRT